MLQSVLETLLKEDGIVLPRQGGAEKSVTCFSPHHDDKTASMSVNVSKGVYNCHGCGASGNAYQYLTEIRKLSSAEAMKAIEAAGGSETYANSSRKQYEDNERKRKRELKTYPDITDKAYIKSGVLGERVAIYDYTDDTGRITHRVARYEKATDDKDKPAKSYRAFTPTPDGQYWMVGPKSDQLKPEHRIDKYPIYRRREIAAITKTWEGLPEAAKGQIWLTEGEKCADLMAGLTAGPKGKAPIVCALYGGSKHPVENHDLSPLYGQRVLLLADSDKVGRAYMKKLGQHLNDNNTEVRYFLPAGDDHYDVGDAAAKGWDGVIEFINGAGGVQSHAEVFDIKPDETKAPIPSMAMADTPYFRVMGFEGTAVVMQSKVTHKIHKIPANGLSSQGNLIHLAPLKYWQSLAGGNDLSAKRLLVFADSILRAAEEMGEMSTQSTHMWSRGAHLTKSGAIVYNIGNGLIAEDGDGMLTEARPLTQDVESSEIYLPGAKIELVDDKEAYVYCADLFDAIMQYRWDREEHGHAFLGWIVTSLIGGALPFRPMLWLTALPGSGKTFLLEQVVNPLFGSLVTDWANATEAGMAAQTSDTALPAYLDEFEPEPGKERRLQDIMGLIRIATSGGASRTRANQKGEFYQSRPRFSLLMASVDRPTLSEANAQRITPIRLSTKGVENWAAVRDRILKAVEPERSAAIRTHIIRSTAKIARHAKEIEDELIQQEAATREAQIRGALSAGVAFLSADPGFRIGRSAKTLADEYRPFATLMQTTLRQKFDEDITCAQALRRAYFEDNGNFVGESWASDAQRILRSLMVRQGFKFADGDTLYCAIDWRPMVKMLEGTPYMHIDLSEYLLQLPEAARPRTEAGNFVRANFAGVTKSVVALPMATLKKMGLFVF